MSVLTQILPWADPGRFVSLGKQLADFSIALVVLYLFARFVVVPAANLALSNRYFEPALESLLRKTVRAVALVMVVILAAAFAGFGGLLGGASIIIGAITFALGFAAQDMIENIVSGAFLVRDPSVNHGDWVEWDDQTGIIDEIGLRTTRVKTFNDELVTVPNADLANGTVKNYTAGHQLRVTSEFGVAGLGDIQDMREAVLQAAEEVPDVLDNPAPSVVLSSIEGDAVMLEARYWIRNPDRQTVGQTLTQFHDGVVHRANVNDLEIGTTTSLDVGGNLSVSAIDADGDGDGGAGAPDELAS